MPKARYQDLVGSCLRHDGAATTTPGPSLTSPEGWNAGSVTKSMAFPWSVWLAQLAAAYVQRMGRRVCLPFLMCICISHLTRPTGREELWTGVRELQEDDPAPPLNQSGSVSCRHNLGAGDSGRANCLQGRIGLRGPAVPHWRPCALNKRKPGFLWRWLHCHNLKGSFVCTEAGWQVLVLRAASPWKWVPHLWWVVCFQMDIFMPLRNPTAHVYVFPLYKRWLM